MKVALSPSWIDVGDTDTVTVGVAVGVGALHRENH